MCWGAKTLVFTRYFFSAGIAAGTYTGVVTDSNGCEGSISITITQPDPLSILPVNLPNATLAVNYSYTFGAIGGTPPYTWIASGNLPYGLNLSEEGVISGTPTQTDPFAGPYEFTLEVKDYHGCTAVTGSLSITVCPVILVEASTTPVSYEGANDGSITLTVEGGVEPYSYYWTGPSDFRVPRKKMTLL